MPHERYCIILGACDSFPFGFPRQPQELVLYWHHGVGHEPSLRQTDSNMDLNLPTDMLKRGSASDKVIVTFGCPLSLMGFTGEVAGALQ
jgi:hypothetical protein